MRNGSFSPKRANLLFFFIFKTTGSNGNGKTNLCAKSTVWIYLQVSMMYITVPYYVRKPIIGKMLANIFLGRTFESMSRPIVCIVIDDHILSTWASIIDPIAIDCIGHGHIPLKIQYYKSIISSGKKYIGITLVLLGTNYELYAATIS